MRTTEYTDAEIETKDRWDKLFWIELAKRKERLVTGDAQRMLEQLHDEIAEVFNGLSQHLDEPIEGSEGAAILLDAFQWNSDPSDRAYDEAQAELLCKVMNQFNHQIEEVCSKLRYTRGFRFADFAVPNDFEHMWDWWACVNSAAGRKEFGIKEGKFSNHGKKVVEDEDHDKNPNVESHVFYQRPGRSPIRVTNRRVRSFSTDVDKVLINGDLVTDSVVIIFDFNTPAPSRREIVNAAYSSRGLVQSRLLASAWSKGNLAEIERLLEEPAPRIAFADLFDPVEDHQLFKAQTSVAPLLRGLYAWDLVNDKRLSDAESSRITADTLRGMGTTARNVINALKTVRHKVNTYTPEMLPWIY